MAPAILADRGRRAHGPVAAVLPGCVAGLLPELPFGIGAQTLGGTLEPHPSPTVFARPRCRPLPAALGWGRRRAACVEPAPWLALGPARSVAGPGRRATSRADLAGGRSHRGDRLAGLRRSTGCPSWRRCHRRDRRQGHLAAPGMAQRRRTGPGPCHAGDVAPAAGLSAAGLGQAEPGSGGAGADDSWLRRAGLQGRAGQPSGWQHHGAVCRKWRQANQRPPQRQAAHLEGQPGCAAGRRWWGANDASAAVWLVAKPSARLPRHLAAQGCAIQGPAAGAEGARSAELRSASALADG